MFAVFKSVYKTFDMCSFLCKTPSKRCTVRVNTVTIFYKPRSGKSKKKNIQTSKFPVLKLLEHELQFLVNAFL